MRSKLITLTLLTILLVSLKSNASINDFQLKPLFELEPKLQYAAPTGEFVMYDIGKGWLIINAAFFQEIHLKLSKCDKYQEIVSPIKTEMIFNPNEISWYQNKSVILTGVPIIFFAGLLTAMMSK